MTFFSDSHLCAGFLRGVDKEGRIQTVPISPISQWAGTCLHLSKHGNSVSDVISVTRIKLFDRTVIFCVKNYPYHIILP